LSLQELFTIAIENRWCQPAAKSIICGFRGLFSRFVILLLLAISLTAISRAQVNCPALAMMAPEREYFPASGIAAECFSSDDVAGSEASSDSSLCYSTSRSEREFTLDMAGIRALPDPVTPVWAPQPPARFQLRNALLQSFEYLMLQHAFRVANDPSLRYQLAHGRFFHNWFAAYGGYNLKRWGDGDDILVNDVGHPLQGAVASRIFLQNSPKARALTIGKDPSYWTSRLKGMAWAAAFEVQWKVGPLGETSLGNAGGWMYVPGCGFSVSCANDPEYSKPPTNNTGLSDWILTPVVGTGWVLLEDTIDKYLVARVAENHRIVGGMILRTALEPSRSFAGLFMGKLPWQWPTPERYLVKPVNSPANTNPEVNRWEKQRRSFGIHYANVNLPAVTSECADCRQYNAGIGVNYGYRILPYLFFDGEFDFFPGGGGSNGRPSLEGLFGTKVGYQGRTWGLFGKVRPGFIYYEKAWSGGQSPKFDNLSRFALDTGGVVELYPSRSSTVRLDIGTTLVRYLRDYPNPRLSPLGSLQSPDYYVTQGNFQISSGYIVRF
jgi:hypothetical protein